MYRQVYSKVVLSSSRSSLWNRRGLAAAATSREKRALNAKQMGAEAASKPAAAAAPTPEASSGGGGSSSSSLLPVLGVLAVAGAGGAYAMDLIPQEWMGGGSSRTTPIKEVAPTPTPKQDAVVKKEAAPTSTKEELSSTAAQETEESTTTTVSAAKGHRVVEISLPPGSPRDASKAQSVPAVTQHPTGGHKVTMSPANSSPQQQQQQQQQQQPEETSPRPTPADALAELQAKLARETDTVLAQAHEELAQLANVPLQGLDDLTPTQLKIRLVQVTKDLQDRTQWEAIRLKEFLALKEREVQDEYSLLMKQQRLEAEGRMEQRMREQQAALEAAHLAALLEKEAALQGVVDQSLALQEQQYKDEQAGFEKRVEEAMNAKYEEMYGTRLAQAKQEFAQKMQSKVEQMEKLTKKISDLEYALQSTKDFEEGSVQAHRMSAAAIALIDKLESHAPAGAAVDALKAVAANNPVVTSALDALPPTVAMEGVANLQELQTRFEERVLPKARQAALVPAGQQGLEGQLMGMLFSTLKYAPSPDDAAPDSEKDASEYVLARARRAVQLGDLEQAVAHMELLEGQPKFTTKDWVTSAKERVAVEKALKVIRMECALANESMGSGPVASSG